MPEWHKAQITTQTFSYSGTTQTFVVPACVTSITLEARGAQGAAGTVVGGNGGSASGVMAVTPGQTLVVYVGGQSGFNGGGTGTTLGGNGGGASDVRMSPYTLNDRVIVGGGGGGGGGSNTTFTISGGGTGGGGTVGPNYAGGAAGYGFATHTGTNGGSTGGAGGVGNGSNNGGSGGGGGGGSSYTGTLTSPSFTPGNQSGDGLVRITYNSSGASVIASSSSTVICTGNTATLNASGVASYTWSTSSNATSVTVSPTVTTAYTVQGTNTLGCVSSAVITMSVNSGAPVMTISPSSPSICLNNTLILTANGAITYTWNNGVSNGVAFTPSATSGYTVTGANACTTSTAAITITVAPLPVTISPSSTLICSGTAATLTAASATNYTWMPGANSNTVFIISPTANTVYTLTGTSGVCSGSTTLLISTKANPTLAIAASNTTICNGNSTNLSVTGNAVSYTWNPGGAVGTLISVSPTLTTLYSVTGTNSLNCVSSISQVILVYSNPIVSAGVSNPTVCSGGASTLTASGANSYLWSTSDPNPVTVVNPTGNTTYSVTGTSTNNCSGTATVSVSVFEPTLGVSSNTAICAGANAVISANGADTYLWSNNGSTFPSITVSPSVSTTYSVTGSVTDPVSNISCNAGNTVQVTVNPNPTITATANHSVICLGTSATLTASGASTYTWTGGAGAVQSASMSVSPIANQTYTVAGIDNNGCKGTGTLQVHVAPCTGISSVAADNASILIYPNPSNGEFTITSDQEIALQIISESGQLVKTIALNGANTSAHISDLASGIYMIVGSNSNGFVKQKIVVAK